MRRRVKYMVYLLVAAVLVVGVYLVQRSVTAPSASAASGSEFSAFYLDLGASTSLGFQPTGIVNHNGRRTNTGYANDLLEVENIKGVSLTLTQLGCPGETVQTILGHADIATTEIYTHVAKDHLKKVMNKAHPLSKERKPR